MQGINLCCMSWCPAWKKGMGRMNKIKIKCRYCEDKVLESATEFFYHIHVRHPEVMKALGQVILKGIDEIIFTNYESRDNE